jgi:hypothetical protein
MKLQQIYDNNFPASNLITETDSVCNQVVTTLNFNIINKLIKINITHLCQHDNKLIIKILKSAGQSLPFKCKGYYIEFSVDQSKNVVGSVIEYVCSNSIINVVNEYITNNEWEYIIVKGHNNDRNRIHNALAQRLTVKQPSVERFFNLENYFLITKF